MLLYNAIIDFYSFYDRTVDMQIWVLLTSVSSMCYSGDLWGLPRWFSYLNIIIYIINLSLSQKYFLPHDVLEEIPRSDDVDVLNRTDR